MKKFVCLLLVSLAPTVLTGCLVDDLADAIDDALGEDGDKTCGEALQAMITRLESCTEGGYLQEGETASEKAGAWCNENCSRLHNDVQLDEYANCASQIGNLSCEDIEGDPAEVKEVTHCGWLENDLGC